jgi:dGTPase
MPDWSATALAPWAADPRSSRGRVHPEDAPVGRDAYQRDRDRIIHSPSAASNTRRRCS